MQLEAARTNRTTNRLYSISAPLQVASEGVAHREMARDGCEKVSKSAKPTYGFYGTYLVIPELNATLGVISSPSGPTALSIDIVANIVADNNHSVVSARWRPGQILERQVHQLRNS